MELTHDNIRFVSDFPIWFRHKESGDPPGFMIYWDFFKARTGVYESKYGDRWEGKACVQTSGNDLLFMNLNAVIRPGVYFGEGTTLQGGADWMGVMSDNLSDGLKAIAADHAFLQIEASDLLDASTDCLDSISELMRRDIRSCYEHSTKSCVEMLYQYMDGMDTYKIHIRCRVRMLINAVSGIMLNITARTALEPRCITQ